jgi:hypothetical protein
MSSTNKDSEDVNSRLTGLIEILPHHAVLMYWGFDEIFKKQTGDRNSHKNKGSSISFLEIPTVASNLTPRNGNKFASRQRKLPKYPDSIAQFLKSKTVATTQNAVKERSEMALIVISSMN